MKGTETKNKRIMEVKGTLLANNKVTVDIKDDYGRQYQARFNDVKQMEELAHELMNEAKRIGKLIPAAKPRYVEAPLFKQRTKPKARTYETRRF